MNEEICYTEERGLFKGIIYKVFGNLSSVVLATIEIYKHGNLSTVRTA